MLITLSVGWRGHAWLTLAVRCLLEGVSPGEVSPEQYGQHVDNILIPPAMHPVGSVVPEPVGDTCHGYPRLRTFQPRA